MKITIATDNYSPRYDGVSRFLQEIIPALAEKHEVNVIAPDFGNTKDKWEVFKIKVLRFKIGDFHPTGLHFIKIFNIVRKSEVVFLQTLGSIGTLALIAAKLTRKKTVMFIHTIEWELIPKAVNRTALKRTLPNIIKKIDRILYKWINLVLIPSQGISDKYLWNKIENKRRIIHLGVDSGKFKPAKDKIAAKKKLGIDPKTIVVGYHGRLAREKDLKTLLRGYLRFKANTKQKTKLLIVGDGLASVRKLFDRQDTIVTGFQENVIKYLQAMDIYVHSSLTETSCLSVMEAMSCELPVISTPAGYVKDYIDDGKNGFLYKFKDTVMLGKLLEKCMNKRTRTRIGTAARNTMMKKFSWSKTRKEIIKVFEHL